MGRITRTGAWISVLPPTVNGMELGSQEFRDYIFLRCFSKQPDLPDYCDRCGSTFTIYHSLHCMKGGLITAHYNDLRDGVANLASRAFIPTHVRG